MSGPSEQVWGLRDWCDLPGFEKPGAQVGGVEVKWTFRLTVLKKLQVPQCTTSRPVQPAHYFKWEHLRRKGGLSKHSSKHFSRERDTRKGSTRGATKEATGTVTYWVLLRWLFAVESAVIIIDGCISWLICVMILTKQHTAYRQHAYQLAACKWVWLFVWVYFVDYKLNNDVWSAFPKHLCCILFAVIKQSLCH